MKSCASLRHRCLKNVHICIRESAAEAGYEIGSLVEELNNETRFQGALEGALFNPDEPITDEQTRLVGELLLRDFEQCGGNLEKSLKEQAIELHRKHLEYQQKFQQYCFGPGTIKVGDLPTHVKNGVLSLQGKPDHADISVDSPWTLMPSEHEREAIYRIYHSDNLGNGEQMENLLQLIKTRHELAKIYKYDSWSARAIQHSFAENPEFVDEFLKSILSEVDPMSAVERANILEMKKRDSKAFNKDTIFPWDEFHYGQNEMNKNVTELSEYLTLSNAIKGISNIFESLCNYKLMISFIET